jgi:hypothetical protein
MTLALKGRAVSPVTSYLAIEPGVRPSTEGLEDEGGGSGFGISLGGIGSSSHCGVRVTAPGFDREAYLRTSLAAELARCGGKADTAYARIETTLDEIVEVQTGAQRGQLDTAVAGCFQEAVWSLLLPSAFDDESATYRVEI